MVVNGGRKLKYLYAISVAIPSITHIPASHQKLSKVKVLVFDHTYLRNISPIANNAEEVAQTMYATHTKIHTLLSEYCEFRGNMPYHHFIDFKNQCARYEFVGPQSDWRSPLSLVLEGRYLSQDSTFDIMGLPLRDVLENGVGSGLSTILLGSEFHNEPASRANHNLISIVWHAEIEHQKRGLSHINFVFAYSVPASSLPV
ncbi:uncharacterized protein MELLADRAFT_104631 [Melampsora larici-populina 98AG31]|uniref:Uncharacterized protein n=1 Tax=Melampsora larici-populina (strain 98AG31 / pathotype 3-4-7) TaxID=747676 RepID=F4RFD1_MELLP|nr:uncharacterized protein MELLADRAFT_104631 [Melampsora larici-populina 98AG31]EGG08795.1 hypothetical protein MELLADRAFT_104631 [Melampsora larici-populina 98AG31]